MLPEGDAPDQTRNPDQEPFASVVTATPALQPTGQQATATVSTTETREQKGIDFGLDRGAGSTSPRDELEQANVDPVDTGPLLPFTFVEQVCTLPEFRSDPN